MATARSAALIEGWSALRLETQSRAVSRWSELLDTFGSVHGAAARDRFARMRSLIMEFASVQEATYELHRGVAPHFDLFRLLGGENDELLHSRILAWIFDPYGSHAQGAELFRAACAGLGLNVEFTGREYHVRTEHKELEARIDIVAYGRDFLIYFENKIGAGEGVDQTHRESRDMASLAKRLRVPVAACTGVYVSPRRARVASPLFRSVTWQELTEAMNPTVEATGAIEVRCFLKQWFKTLARTGVDE